MAPVVVFAAAVEPGNPSDVAIGLALAAHMVEANGGKVSLVVIPHYLESDQELEKTLERQHELVTGGVVLGETPTVPEDTRVLLRQLLTSTDRQGVAAQLQDNLGSVASLIAALLALGGLAIAAGIAGPEIIKQLELAEQKRIILLGKPTPPVPKPPVTQPPVRKPHRLGRWPVRESDWLTALGSNRKVIIWLRSGRQVVGTIESQFPEKTRDATVFRVKPTASQPGPDEEYMLVSVKEIEMIHVNKPKPDQGKA